ncbi:uncharacterized protein TNCV_1299311 [Trichonephila clavipes]|nr:uncharacterized protein TNCV_1299311 [Trichonephila clavipes]
MALTDRADTSQALSQKLRSFARQFDSVRTNSLEMFAAAWTLSYETMATAILDVASQTVASLMVCRIRVCRHHGERTLATCIRNRPIGPSPGMMVWGAIVYMSRSLLVHIDGTLNSARYISGVLRPVALPLYPSPREILRFSRIMPNHMLLVLY